METTEAQFFADAARRRGIPEHMVQGLVNYITHGQPPGGFLTALLNNDFVGAVGSADLDNAARLQNYAAFIYNDAPMFCWGSKDRVAHWIEQGGLQGSKEQEDD